MSEEHHDTAGTGSQQASPSEGKREAASNIPADPKTKAAPEKGAKRRRGATASGPSGGEARAAQGGRTATGTVALVVALAAGAGAAGGGYYLWRQIEQLDARAVAGEASRQEALAALRLQNESDAASAARRDQQLAETVEAADAQLAARQEALAQGLAELRTRLGQDRRDWVAAEVEHLLRIANQRLHFAGDIPGALAALEAADRRIASMDDPGYLPVREALSTEMQALRNLGPSEREDAAVRLTGLIQTVDTLPVSAASQVDARPKGTGEATAPETGIPVSDWRSFAAALWRDIRGLVTIRRHGADEIPGPLLAPEQRFFLYQNLRLELETARLALLRGNGTVYRASLAQAGAWLDRFFVEAAATDEFRTAVAELSRVPTERDLPAIDESLRRLRDIEARRGGTESGA